ncbi:MAG TPA: phosphohistidine phosphatase SixA [Candidatus Nitrosotenuis sp.]|jgi:phosphohistidine phosphatase|nr:phosphohistidine phosphatase SixA [Candidatus Nitrosotenuis sp.]
MTVVYLMQHGESLPEELDPRRPLSQEGRVNVQRVAEAASTLGLAVSHVYHSGKERARQSAEILARALGAACLQREGLGPNDPVEPVAEWLWQQGQHGVGALALVGHLPFLDRLTSLLVTGRPDLSLVAFRYGALVRLAPAPEPQRYRIEWILRPEFAAALASA